MPFKQQIERLEFLLKETQGELSNANAIITKQEIEIGKLFTEQDMKDFQEWCRNAVHNSPNELLACWKQKKEKMIYGEDLDD